MIHSASIYFADRTDAGRQLATLLRPFANQPDTFVLAIPRGGVPVAYEVAYALHAPLDIFLSRKLGVPGNEEFAFGAVVVGDGRYINESIVEAAAISQDEIEQITTASLQELERRARILRGDRPPPSVSGKTVILVDDGIATGASIYAAVRALRNMRTQRVIIAVPVVPRSTLERLQHEVDQFVTVSSPEDFQAVGQFYRDFRQTSDQEVIELLARVTAETGGNPPRSHGATP